MACEVIGQDKVGRGAEIPSRNTRTQHAYNIGTQHSPLLVDQQFELIQKVNQKGTTIFMVEQNANMALSIADRGYVLQTGSIVLADTASNLLCNELMQEAYLGGADVCDMG